MTGSLSHAAPVRFLIGVMLAWTVGRGVALAGWRPAEPGPGSAARLVSHPRRAWIADIAPLPSAIAVPFLLRRLTPKVFAPIVRIGDVEQPRSPSSIERAAGAPALMLASYTPRSIRDGLRSSGIVAAKAIAGAGSPGSRFSGSAWAFLRGGGRARLLSPAGQIGGGQAGARLLYTVDRSDRLAVSARVSRTIGGIRQAEAAAGLDWKPIADLPVHLMLDRRFAIDRGGRNAWTLGAAGGVDDVRVAPGWRLDGYGEAGVVGARRRDLYADGAARIARAIDLGNGRSLSVGGGIWGAAQPGATRLDLGPSAVLRAPVAGHVLAVALDWRERVAGGAKPGSGVALTVATDF